MSLIKVYFVVAVFVTAVGIVYAQIYSKPQQIDSVAVESTLNMCPTSEESQRARQNLSSEIQVLLTRRVCGGPGWRRVAFINMSNTNHTCPSGLRLVTSPTRVCGSSRHLASRSCSSSIFNVQGSSYRFVCGRITGYHTGAAYAFWASLNDGRVLEGDYLDGVSLTYGSAGQRQHIWSFAVGLNNNPNYRNPTWNCPRITSAAPPMVGNDYFCESAQGNSTNPLWDGQGCPFSPGTYCNINNPPWFNKQLPNSTTDNIEMRVCKWLDNDVTTLSLIELYVL